MSRRLALVALPIAAVIALGGCGGSDDGGSGGSGASASPSESAASEAAQQTVRDWLEASVDGDTSACALETKSFSDAANKATFANIGRPGEDGFTCPQRIKRSASVLFDIGGDDYGDVIKNADLRTLDSTDTTVTVEVAYNENGDPTTFGLVLDGEDWLIKSDSAIPSTVTPGGTEATG